jgi:Phage tail lysozyme
MASEFGRRAYNYYLNLGYRPVQAAALAGNAMAESGGSTNIVGDQGKALGLFQWHPDRQARLFSYAQSQGLDPRSETAQLGFFDWELKNTEKRAGEMLSSAQTPEAAQAAVLASLRPRGFSMSDPTQSHNYGGRLKNTMSLLGTEGGGVTPMDPSALSGAQTTPTSPVYAQDPLTSLRRIGNAIAPGMVDPATPLTPAQMQTGGLLGGQNSLLGGNLGNMGLALMQQEERMQRAMPLEEDLGPGVQQGRFQPIRFSRGLL